MDDGSTAGRLLVASPDLTDPNFERSVIYVIDHDEAGAIGVVLNRPADTEVDEVLPALAPTTAVPRVMFLGGPVSTQGIICLARARPGRSPTASITFPALWVASTWRNTSKGPRAKWMNSGCLRATPGGVQASWMAS